MNIKSDLHLHTTFSDGEFTPLEIVRRAAALGIRQIAVTDHDTIDGVGEALAAGEEHGVSVVPGIEVTLSFARDYFVGSLHLLVYFPGELLSSREFTGELGSIVSRGRGTGLVRARVQKINEEFGPRGKDPVLSSPLTVESITSMAPNVSRRHFARVLTTEYGLTPRQITMLIGNSSPAYLPSGIDMELLRPLFSRYPMVPVLAHPAAGSFPGESHYREVLPPFSTVVLILPELLDLGLRGLEVHYPGHTAADTRSLESLAISLNLLVTGGSDCHDDSERPMGTAGLLKPVDFASLF